MNDRGRSGRIFFILAVFGLVSLFSMLRKPSFDTIRPVDVVQLIGTGVCFGAVAVVLFLRSPRST